MLSKARGIARRRARGGQDASRAEFERLYRENYRLVYNFVYSRLLDRAETEDVVSDAFLNAARAFDRFDPQRASFSTWVISIARNCMATRFRRKGPEVLADDVQFDLASVGEDDASFGDYDSTELATQLLSVLDEEERELINLKFFQEMKNTEIAEVLGINASTVGTRVQRAVAKMREHMA